jgi:hypothetical protein
MFHGFRAGVRECFGLTPLTFDNYATVVSDSRQVESAAKRAQDGSGCDKAGMAMQRDRDNAGGWIPCGDVSAQTAPLARAAQRSAARNDDNTPPVTLNLFQGPLRGLTRGWLMRVFWPQTAKQAKSEHLARWALKQVQGDELGWKCWPATTLPMRSVMMKSAIELVY